MSRRRPRAPVSERAEPAVLVLIDDVTERRRLTLALERSYTELRETQAKLIQAGKLTALGELAGGVAHELNNPLTGVLMLSEGISERLGDPALATYPELPRMKQLLQGVTEGAIRSRNIVHNLLAFARQTPATFEALSLEEVLKRTLGLLENQLRTARIKVELATDGPLPKVVASANQLQQVFTNIIINAWQAMPNGGELRIGAGPGAHGMVVVAITDTGIGIPPENLDRIFEPFFTTKPAGKGTGLGLSLAWGLIQEHGGHIEVESSPGRGTTLRVLLPSAGEREAKTEKADAGTDHRAA